MVTCLLLEVSDPKKANLDYLLHCKVRFSWDKSSTEEKNASIGMRATNDPSESQFETFTEALATGGRVESSWTWHLELARHDIIITLDVIRINM